MQRGPDKAPVGEFLADELAAREWTQAEFAEILGRPPQFVSEIISGKKEITRESAAQIAAAFKTTPELWLGLQDEYHLWRQRQNRQTQAELRDVQLRVRLKELAPVTILRQRGILKSSSLEGQAKELKALFELDDVNDNPRFAAAARRSNPAEAVSTTQISWLACVRQRARDCEVASYESEALYELAGSLSTHLACPEGFQHLPQLFADVGVRLVYVEALPGSKLDGCSFTLDGVPVIGLSGRGRRLDKVLFTLLHEVAHIVLRHVDDVAIVDDAEDQATLGEEKTADALAAQWILPGGLSAVPDRINLDWIQRTAASMRVHPIVIVGNLQKRGRLTWRTSLVKGAPAVTTYLKAW
jgi:HTH-type transcriptional regulator/antitoxin HigA